jgi:hypothetical protein
MSAAIMAFFTKFGTAMQFIIPLLRVLWKILNPKIKNLLDNLWEFTEAYVEQELDNLEKENPGDTKSEIKEKVFNKSAKKELEKTGDKLTPAELTIARELVHYKKMKQRAKRI